MNHATLNAGIATLASRRRQGGHSFGFTLVELLVVVAIVAILVSLLMPLGSAAMATARQASTASSLRQIGLAIVSYAADHDGTLPGPSCGAIYNYGRKQPQDGDTPHMGAYLAPYLGAPDNLASTYYLTPVKGLQCPALKPAARKDSGAANWYKWDYPVPSADNIFGANVGMGTPGGLSFTGARQVTPQPRRLAALTDKQLRTPVISTVDEQIWPNAAYASEIPATGIFHGKRLWLFLDGSQALSDSAVIWQR